MINVHRIALALATALLFVSGVASARDVEVGKFFDDSGNLIYGYATGNTNDEGEIGCLITEGMVACAAVTEAGTGVSCRTHNSLDVGVVDAMTDGTDIAFWFDGDGMCTSIIVRKFE